MLYCTKTPKFRESHCTVPSSYLLLHSTHMCTTMSQACAVSTTVSHHAAQLQRMQAYAGALQGSCRQLHCNPWARKVSMRATLQTAPLYSCPAPYKQDTRV